ncbi:MAG: NADPH:quinone oxidoreductase family protein [Roseovarius sp.]
MRAIILNETGRAENCRLSDVASLVPGPGQVLVQVASAGVAFADLLMVMGKYQNTPATPFIPGMEAAGRIEALGEGVEGLVPGQRVLAIADFGAHAEQICLPAHQVLPITDGVSFDAAVAMGVSYLTAWCALFPSARLERGETVFVTGASGGVGQAAIQLAKAHGATVLAGLSNMEKAGVARSAGADHLINLSHAKDCDAVRAEVYAATNEKGADILVDVLGGAPFASCLRTLAWRGRAVVLGFTTGEIPSVATNYLLLKTISVQGLQVTAFRDKLPDTVRSAMAAMCALYEDGRIRPQIQSKFALGEVDRAFALIAGREVTGRLLIDPSAP